MWQRFPVTLGINQSMYMKWNNHFSLQFHVGSYFLQKHIKRDNFYKELMLSTLKSHDPEWKWLTLIWKFWSDSCFWCLIFYKTCYTLKVKLQQNGKWLLPDNEQELFGIFFFNFFENRRKQISSYSKKINQPINQKLVERKKVCSFDQKRLVFSGSKTIGHKYYAETKPQSNKIMFKFHVCLVLPSLPYLELGYLGC